MRLPTRWIPLPGLAALVLALTLALACGGGGGGGGTPPPALAAPAITAHPLDTDVPTGSSASFTVAASGNPAPTFSWARSNDAGLTWQDIPGALAATYTLPSPQAADSGAQFRATAANSQGQAVSNPAWLTVNVPAAAYIITDPADQILPPAGGSASFTVTAGGVPAPAIQWQQLGTDGVTWSDITGATTATYSLSATTANNGQRFRAKVSNASGTEYSQPATLSVGVAAAPVITAQPANQTANPGDSVTFTVGITGYPAPTVQWQGSLDGGATWIDIPGATLPGFTFIAPAGDSGLPFQAVVSNSVGSVTSSMATLTVGGLAAPALTLQPRNVALTAPGGTATFQVTASGAPPLAYQWQYLSPGATSWNNVTFGTGGNAALFTFNATAANGGYQFRVLVSNGTPTTATSNPATLTVSGSGAAAVYLGAELEDLATGDLAAYLWSNGTWNALPAGSPGVETNLFDLAADPAGLGVYVGGLNQTGIGSAAIVMAGYWAPPTATPPAIPWVPLATPAGAGQWVATALAVLPGGSGSATQVLAAGIAVPSAPLPPVPVPGYWVGGTWVSLPGLAPTQPALTSCIAATATSSGVQVYVGGAGLLPSSSGGPGRDRPVVWDPTGKANVLPILDPAGEAAVTSLALSGPDVYAGGFCTDATGIQVPGYWKNGAWSGLTPLSGTSSSQVNVIVVSGTDIYAGGFSTDGTGRKPGYWKNGLFWNALPLAVPATGSGSVDTLVVSGSDVYAAGRNVDGGGNSYLGYWKNGAWVAVTQPAGILPGNVTSMAVVP